MSAIKSEFAQCCDDFFRAAGCTFAEPAGPEDGDFSPGELLEVLAPLAHARGAVPEAQSVLDSIRLHRKDLTCPAQFVRAFSSIWKLLGPPRDGYEGRNALATSRQNARGSMRLFCDLMQRTSALSDALDLAIQVLEGVECVAKPRPALNDSAPAPPPRNAVFLSYSTKDDAIVTGLTEKLIAVADATFIANGRTLPGARRREGEFAALDEASVVVVFWSHNSFKSVEVIREWVTARHFGKRVVPGLLDSTPLDPLLADYRAVDLRSPPRTAERGGAPVLNLLESYGAILKLLEAITVAP